VVSTVCLVPVVCVAYDDECGACVSHMFGSKTLVLTRLLLLLDNLYKWKALVENHF
jgi:hypothetical protein